MEVVTEELFCEGCGDPVAIRDSQTKLGPCCHNLPNPWHRGSDGYYNQTSETEHDSDEEDASLPTCSNCGTSTWRITGEQDYESQEGDAETIYYSPYDFDVSTVRCANCGERNRGRYDVETL